MIRPDPTQDATIMRLLWDCVIALTTSLPYRHLFEDMIVKFELNNQKFLDLSGIQQGKILHFDLNPKDMHNPMTKVCRTRKRDTETQSKVR